MAAQQQGPHPRALSGRRADNKYAHDRYDDKYCDKAQDAEDAKTLAP